MPLPVRPALLALGLALPATQGDARCVRTFTLTNTSATHWIHVDEALSRTRANATWSDMGDPRRVRLGAQGCVSGTGAVSVQGQCGFIASAAPGSSTRFTATYAVLGCGVARRSRIVYTCAGPNNDRRQRTIDLHGGAYADPRDMTLRLGC